MIPGLTTKLSEQSVASAATVDVTTDILKVTGTTSIATLTPHFGGGFSGLVVIWPTDGNVATLTTGNIAVAVTMPQNRATLLVYSKLSGTWAPGAIS